MGFGFQTPISWQAEMWVLRNAKGGIATKKGGCWPMQGIWNAPLGNKKNNTKNLTYYKKVVYLQNKITLSQVV